VRKGAQQNGNEVARLPWPLVQVPEPHVACQDLGDQQPMRCSPLQSVEEPMELHKYASQLSPPRQWGFESLLPSYMLVGIFPVLCEVYS
jgi:hypothetical protein